jgi:hypothetical protein
VRAVLVLATLCSALGAAPAAAESERRVGIVVTTLVNVSDEKARELASALGEVLHERLVVDVIAGAETERRLPPGGVPAGCVADDDCRQDLGRRLDAEELLLLVMVGAGPRLKVDPTWVHVASGKITSRPAIEIAPDADVRALLGTAAPTLLPHMAAREQRRGPDVVVVTAGGTTAPQPGRRLRPPTLIVAGVSAGALIGASVFALSSQRKFDALEEDDCRRMPCDPREVDSLRRDTILADVFFGVAVVTAGAAVTMYLLDDGDPPAARTDQPSLNVGPGPGAVGLSLGGAF